MMHSAGAIATDVTPSHTMVQELQLRASVSAVRQLHLQVLRGGHLLASFVPTSGQKGGSCTAVVVAGDSVSRSDRANIRREQGSRTL